MTTPPGVITSQQVNDLHRYDDLDKSPQAHHHTLGSGPRQAAPGNHTHTTFGAVKFTGKITASAGLQVLGNADFQDLYIDRNGDPTSGSPLKDSYHIYFNSAYWNGASISNEYGGIAAQRFGTSANNYSLNYNAGNAHFFYINTTGRSTLTLTTNGAYVAPDPGTVGGVWINDDRVTRSCRIAMSTKKAANSGGTGWVWYADADGEVVGTDTLQLWGYPRNNSGTITSFASVMSFTMINPTVNGANRLDFNIITTQFNGGNVIINGDGSSSALQVIPFGRGLVVANAGEVQVTGAQNLVFLPQVATSGVPLQDSGRVFLRSAYWNGSSSQIDDTYIYSARTGSSANQVSTYYRTGSAASQNHHFQNTNGSYVPILASAFTVSSKRKFKLNIRKPKNSNLELVKAAPVFNFNYRPEVADSERLRLFPLADHIPEEYRVDNDHLDLATMVGILWGAVTELNNKLEEALGARP